MADQLLHKRAVLVVEASAYYWLTKLTQLYEMDASIRRASTLPHVRLRYTVLVSYIDRLSCCTLYAELVVHLPIRVLLADKTDIVQLAVREKLCQHACVSLRSMFVYVYIHMSRVYGASVRHVVAHKMNCKHMHTQKVL